MGHKDVTEGTKTPGSVKVASQGRIFSINGPKANTGSTAKKTSGLTVTNSKG